VSEAIRLYLDEDTINRALIKGLRARNLDILSAHEAGLVSVLDHEHLKYASSLGRAIFTFNTRDYARLHVQWLSEGQSHFGIIVSGQVDIGLIIRRLLTLVDTLTIDDMKDRLEFLSNWR
jgi:hypothetical protein